MKEGATESEVASNGETTTWPHGSSHIFQPPRTCSSGGKASHFHPATVCEMMIEKGGTRRELWKREKGVGRRLDKWVAAGQRGVWKGRALLKEKRAERQGQQKRGDRAVCDCPVWTDPIREDSQDRGRSLAQPWGPWMTSPGAFQGPLLRFCSCRNKRPQIRWLKAIEICPLIVEKTRSPKSKLLDCSG